MNTIDTWLMFPAPMRFSRLTLMQVQWGRWVSSSSPNTPLADDEHLGLQTPLCAWAHRFPLAKCAKWMELIIATSTGGHAVGWSTSSASRGPGFLADSRT